MNKIGPTRQPIQNGVPTERFKRCGDSLMSQCRLNKLWPPVCFAVKFLSSTLLKLNLPPVTPWEGVSKAVCHVSAGGAQASSHGETVGLTVEKIKPRQERQKTGR